MQKLFQSKSLMVLAVLHVFVVSTAIAESGWTKTITLVGPAGLGAVILSLLIARALLPGLVAHLFSAIIGLGWSFWVTTTLLPAEYSWAVKWETMMTRLFSWYYTAVEGGVSYDNLMFVFQMCLIVWSIAYLTIWFLFRSEQIWHAITPGGAVLLINLYYAPNNLTGWFFIFLFVSLVMVIRYNLLYHEERWRAKHIYFRPDISFDFFRDGLIFAALVLGVAWIMPDVDQGYAVRLSGLIEREWRDVQGNWNRLFANINYKPDAMNMMNSFGQALTLGGPRQLTDDLVMSVRSPEGRYWRASIYDEYNGLGWVSNDQEQIDFGTDAGVAALPSFEGREPVTQTYRLFHDGAVILYALGNPITVDRGARAKISYVAPNQANNRPHTYWTTNDAWVEEVTYIESDRSLLADEPYQIVSLVSTATDKDLRDDNSPYPVWITERYLQLPDNMSRRVLDLAVDIMAPHDNPYDKVVAVETYLRKNLTYNEQLNAPPEGRDKVDYILFELKEAYCDYYATAMIVMLRSQGIPARLAAGYARGQVETDDNQKPFYVVRNKNAHSWVEVFFPKYGWIEFEPTSAEPTISRRGDDGSDFTNPLLEKEDLLDESNPLDRVENIETAPEPEALEAESTYQFSIPLWGQVSVPKGNTWTVSGILLLLMVGGLLVYTRRQPGPDLNNKTLSPSDIANLPQVNKIYFAMVKLAAWVGFKKHPAQTPYEHANQLGDALPGIKPEVEFITKEHVQQSFSPTYQSSVRIKAQAYEAWNKIRPLFYQAVVKRGLAVEKMKTFYKKYIG